MMNKRCLRAKYPVDFNQEKRRARARCILPRFVPYATNPKLGRGRGAKTAALRTQADYLDWALSGDFSGFIAADELYDGPFCIFCLSSITGHSSGSRTGSSTTTPPTPTSWRSPADS